MSSADPTVDSRAPSTRRLARLSRILGTLLVVVGIGLIAWAGLVWQWQDPFTALYTHWKQRELESAYETVLKDEAARPAVVPRGADPKVAQAAVRKAALRFRTSSEEGAPIGRIVVPRLGLDMVLVNGTETSTLKKGPGRHLETYMPGEGKLVYVAGHRTTYLAPFAHIDRLARGDPITVETPYATVVYVVTRKRIVDDQDLSVLRSGSHEQIALQACHPRFFATQRYIVWGRPTRVTPRGGAPFRPAG